MTQNVPTKTNAKIEKMILLKEELLVQAATLYSDSCDDQNNQRTLRHHSIYLYKKAIELGLILFLVDSNVKFFHNEALIKNSLPHSK